LAAAGKIRRRRKLIPIHEVPSGVAPMATTPSQGVAAASRATTTRCTICLAIGSFIGSVSGITAGLLVAIEAVLLLLGVFCRYVLHVPLVQIDEIASILFIWLSMLGAVTAYHRVQHMRMSAFVSGGTPQARERFDTMALMGTLLFLGAVMYPAAEHAISEAVMTLPALGISAIWRTLAVPVGLGLMFIVGALRLVSLAKARDLLVVVVIGAFVAAALYGTDVLLPAGSNTRLIVYFVVLLAAIVFSGIPIAFAFGIATVAYLWITSELPLTVVPSRMDEGMSHIILLSVPLFVFLGVLIELTGMARLMVGFLASLLGHLRGGLHFVLIGGMYLVSGISGSKAADMAALAPVLFPEMRARGAKDGELVALLSATGAQTETIPPSIVLITVGSVTGISIASLFAGGLLPALVLGLCLCVVVWRKSRRENLAVARKATVAEIGKGFLMALPALMLPFVIRTAVIEGVATATEVATIGILYSLIYGLLCSVFLRQQLPWNRLGPALVDTAALSGAILFIIGTASAMAWALTRSGFSTQLAGLISALPGGAYAFIAVSIFAFIVLGSVLEGIPAIVLFGPLLFPIARQFGVHEVHYSMIAVLSMGIGLFAPPFGVGYYTACAIAKVDPAKSMRLMLPYLVALAIGLAIVAVFPFLSIGFLPKD
jgi:tripartite ATP-independent transporter DctM subunit